MAMSEPLDLAAIMADHEHHALNCWVRVSGSERCQTYRLAAELAAIQEQLHNALEAIGACAAAHARDRADLTEANRKLAAMEKVQGSV